MEKTKDQMLIEKLRKAGHKTRMGMRPFHGMPPMGEMRPPMMPGMPPHGPGHCRPMDRPPMEGRPPMGMPMMPREILLITLLEEEETGVRQKDIAEKIGINASSLSEQIDCLEKDRYLERKANPDDRRSTLIVLTEKGRARAWEVLDERQKTAADFCSKLTEEEKDTLIRLLVETGDDVVFLMQNPSRSLQEDYEVAVVDALSGSDEVHCYAGVGKIGSEFDPEWKNVYFELYYFDSYSWLYALEDALDGNWTAAMQQWMKHAENCRSAVKRSAACYNMALSCYLLGQLDLAEKWLEQSDQLSPMDGTLALHQSIDKHKKK